MNAPLPHASGAPRQVVLRCDSRLENVEFIGRAVRALCATAGLAARECAHVELAFVEAANNVIRHAYHGEPGHPVQIVFTFDGAAIGLDVIDEGTPMPPRPSPVLDFDPADIPSLPEGGMGLYLIHSVMDQVEVLREDGRNVLRMHRRVAT